MIEREQLRTTSKWLVPNDFSALAPLCSTKSIKYLKESLARLERGMPPTPSFPLYGKRDISILQEWLTEISQKVPVPEFVLAYETKRLEKFAPQGGIPKWDDVKEDFLLYHTACSDVKYISPTVMKEMERDYSTLKTMALSASESLDHLIKTDKIEDRASGWSEFQLKKTDPEAQKIALRMIRSGDWLKGVGYTFTRLVKKKLRLFMPMPFSSMIKQAQYFIPFLSAIQHKVLDLGLQTPFVVWSDKVGFTRCFDLLEKQAASVSNDEQLVYYSLDFEKMDTTTASSQYSNIFIPILNAAFHNRDAARDEAMLFTTTAPIFSPSGTMIGNHGTASGAEVTNGGETVCNDYVQRRIVEILSTFTSEARILARRANGDDSILLFAIKKTLDFEEFKKLLLQAVEQATSETGFRIQIEKQEISLTHGFFCQHIYWYDRDKGKLHWLYPTTLVLNSIINPQKEYTPAQWDKDYRDIDIVQKLDNAANHPWFHDLIQYVMKGMKFPLLGANEQETARILGKYSKYRSLQSLGERYNRQDYQLSSSPSVNYILSIR